jgi:chromosome segregation ATPase
MAEEKTHLFDADSTNPLPLEQFIRQHIAMLVKQGDETREQIVGLQGQVSELREQVSELRGQVSELRERQVKLEEQQNALREEMIGRLEQLSEEMTGRLEQLSQQNLRLEDLGRKIREEIRDLDYKIGPFIKEQINLKRSLEEVRERVGLEIY